MKRLYIIRHAKSSWKDSSLNDYDRPLSKRGKRDAPMMGERLLQLPVKADLVMSSPALRAAKTARKIAKAIDYPKKKIEYRKELYTDSENDVLNTIHSIDNRFDEVLMIGHNPAFTDVAETLSGATIDNIPTCGVFVMDHDVQSWDEIQPGTGHMVLFDYPKKKASS